MRVLVHNKIFTVIPGKFIKNGKGRILFEDQLDYDKMTVLKSLVDFYDNGINGFKRIEELI